MWHRLFREHALSFFWHNLWCEAFLLLGVVVLVFSDSASAAMRLQDRSLFIHDINPGATTSYTVGFRYMSPAAVGSVDLLFCVDPIPYHSCEVPAGFDAAAATLASQAGEMGFSILSKSTNHIVLTRTPQMVGGVASSYVFSNIVNPSDISTSFSIRLRTHASTDASGPQIDFGSVKGQMSNPIVIETQVPPMLTFCVAERVEEDCVETNRNYYTDMGELDPTATLTAQSQMAVGTNASGGFSIIVHGVPPSAGVNVIDPAETLSQSLPGQNQFGINLVANTAPTVGLNPEGQWANAVPSAEYSAPDQYKFISGDEIAYSPNVSLMKKFTVSYILNSRANLRPGVYTTTITYIASGRF